MKYSLFLLLFLLGSCSKDYLVVQQEWVDCQFLASSWVQSPDPRQEDPPMGQRLLVGWSFPLSVFEKDLRLSVKVILWNHEEKCFVVPIQYKRDSTAFYFEDKSCDQKNKILTYRIDVLDASGALIEVWKHQLWTDYIYKEKD